MRILSAKAEKILLSRLGIHSLAEALDRDFSQHPIQRKAVCAHQNRLRGSVRLAGGRFRTEEEQRKWLEKVTALELP